MKIPKQITVALKAEDNCEEIRAWLDKVDAAAKVLADLLANPAQPRIRVSIEEEGPEP